MNRQKINIVMFEDRFGLGGIEKFITNVVSNIDRDRFNIELVVVNKVTREYDALFDLLGVKVTVLLPETEWNPIKRFKKGLPKFKSYLAKNVNKIDILHFNLSDSIDLLYVKLAEKAGVKIRIVHSHNSSATSKIKELAHKIGMLFWSRTPNYFFACSTLAAQWLFPKKIYQNRDYYFIRNAIDVEKYKFDSDKRNRIREENQWDNSLILGEVGRFNTQKNHTFLLNIFAEIIKTHPNSKLVLVGEKSEKYLEIKDLAEKLGLSDKVIFWGKSSKVNDLLQAFDVFMLPSLYEGLPFVLVESQAASLPALVSDTVTKEVKLSKYIEYLSLNKSPKIWADKALELASFTRTPDVESLINEGYDISSMVKNLESLYEKFYGEVYD